MCRLSDGMQMVTEDEDEKRSAGSKSRIYCAWLFLFSNDFYTPFKAVAFVESSDEMTLTVLHNRIELKLEIILALNVEKRI